MNSGEAKEFVGAFVSPQTQALLVSLAAQEGEGVSPSDLIQRLLAEGVANRSTSLATHENTGRGSQPPLTATQASPSLYECQTHEKPA